MNDRCMACAKVISSKRYYCFECLNELKEKSEMEE